MHTLNVRVCAGTAGYPQYGRFSRDVESTQLLMMHLPDPYREGFESTRTLLEKGQESHCRAGELVVSFDPGTRERMRGSIFNTEGSTSFHDVVVGRSVINIVHACLLGHSILSGGV